MNSLGKDVIALQVRANFHTTFLKITPPTKELLSLLSGLGPGRYSVPWAPNAQTPIQHFYLILIEASHSVSVPEALGCRGEHPPSIL